MNAEGLVRAEGRVAGKLEAAVSKFQIPSRRSPSSPSCVLLLLASPCYRRSFWLLKFFCS